MVRPRYKANEGTHMMKNIDTCKIGSGPLNSKFIEIWGKKVMIRLKY